MTKVVKCKKCNWQDDEKYLNKTTDEYGSGQLDTCPNCQDSFNLEDITKEKIE